MNKIIQVSKIYRKAPREQNSLASPFFLLNNERGVLTLDFIFAITIVFGFMMMFFALTVTLSMVEVTQYISFATARSYSGAHETVAAQEALAQNKYSELMATKVFKTLFTQGFFKLQTPQLGDFNNVYGVQSGLGVFWGARIPFSADILNLQLPILGSTTTNSTTGKATISSYLMREVTTTECRENFDRARYTNIKNMNVDGKTVYVNIPTDQAILIMDNGC